jgi:hypothetical protein
MNKRLTSHSSGRPIADNDFLSLGFAAKIGRIVDGVRIAKCCEAEMSMAKARKNSERENRIEMEIIVDAYGPEEQAMGWYYYLEEKLHFPFLATCIAERATSPLCKGDEVEIVRMAPEEECQHEMFVETRG